MSSYGLRSPAFVGTLGVVGGVPGAGIAASGCTESTINVSGQDYRLHVFNSGGTFSILPGFFKIQDVEYLIVGGGGGGGSHQRATGGGGGGRSGTATGTGFAGGSGVVIVRYKI